jgi:hypothetical protein
MNRRSFIRTILGALSSVVFAATGWLMGAGVLTMPTGGAPCPPNNLGIFTPCVKIGCTSGNCVSHLCDYNCAPDGAAQFWWGCSGSPPCSSGFCDYEEDPNGCIPP